MMKSLLIPAIYTYFLFVTCSEASVVRQFRRACPQFFFQGIPPHLNGIKETAICQIYKNAYRFATSYNTEGKIPHYSAYVIKAFKGNVSRRNIAWRIEEEIPRSDQAENSDYALSGYQKGHLNPVAHHLENDNEVAATFKLTNAAPMPRNNNYPIWYAVENQIRVNMEQFCSFPGAKRYILTGVLPSSNSFMKGTKRVNIPKNFWSAACCDSSSAAGNNKTKGWSLGFLNGNYKTSKVNDIYTVEKLTEIIGRETVSSHAKLFDDYKYVKNCLFNATRAIEIMNSIVSNKFNYFLIK